MYLNHFGLDEPPFRITPHTDFFFGGANRGATLEALLYAITNGEGIVKVSGEVGSGKTMLCRVLIERLPGHVDTILLSNPSLAREEILYAIADELKMDVGKERQPLLLRMLQDHLIRLYSQDRRVVVLIDEAHAMPLETLEQIRLLSNLESSHSKLLQIVLFGQPELDEHLNLPHMRQLRERITHSFRLEPLLRSDIEAYLDFRMRAAGYRGPNLFAPHAVRRIAKASEGLTRRVNILADKSLLAAFADDAHGISAKHVDRAIRDSEFYRAPVSRAKIGLAASGLAAGLALGWGLHYLLSPSPPSAAAAQPAAALAPPAPVQSHTAPAAASTSASTSARQTNAQPAGVTQLTPAAVGATAQTEPGAAAAARAAGARPGSRNYVPPAPPAGDLTRARFSAAQEWLSSAPPGHYSIQLLTAGTHDLRRVEDLLERAAGGILKLSDFHVYGVRINDQQHYRLAYGLYPSLAEASQGIKDLPPVYLQFGPYYRSVARMRSQNQQ
jgi:type II secretory pathway predicted ATPase ExeA/septal ring-binding cell division protein DamX